MGTRESYEPGTFSWVELATSDADAAKKFYTELFGWDYDDREVGEGMTYSMAERDGHAVGALFQSDNSPPHWMSYLTVKSADDSAKHAAETGAKVLTEPLDVMEAGRMAVIQDPAGATFAIWEPNEHIGAALVNSSGSLTWNDLMTPDVAEAAKFYCDLFGWEVAPVDTDGTPSDEAATEADDDDDANDADDGDDDGADDEGEGDPEEAAEVGRMVIRVGERLNGGIAKLPDSLEGAPAHWLAYFACDDAQSAAERVESLGGSIMIPPIDVPAGKLAVVADPQGAVLGLFSGDFED